MRVLLTKMTKSHLMFYRVLLYFNIFIIKQNGGGGVLPTFKKTHFTFSSCSMLFAFKLLVGAGVFLFKIKKNLISCFVMVNKAT